MREPSYVEPIRRRRHPILRVTESVVAVVVIILVLLAIFLAVSVRHGAGGQTTVFGRPVYSVGSGSMSPTFETGDLIVDNPVSATAAEHLHKGQIITFEATKAVGTAPGLVITHRIYSVVTRLSVAGVHTVEYRTKGDANNAPDIALVPPSAIQGVYQKRVPFGGYVLNTLHQPITFVILIMIVVVYLAAEIVRRKWIAIGEKDAQRRQAHVDHQGERW